MVWWLNMHHSGHEHNAASFIPAHIKPYSCLFALVFLRQQPVLDFRTWTYVLCHHVDFDSKHPTLFFRRRPLQAEVAAGELHGEFHFELMTKNTTAILKCVPLRSVDSSLLFFWSTPWDLSLGLLELLLHTFLSYWYHSVSTLASAYWMDQNKQRFLKSTVRFEILIFKDNIFYISWLITVSQNYPEVLSYEEKTVQTFYITLKTHNSSIYTCNNSSWMFVQTYPIHLDYIHVPVLGLDCLRIQLKDTTETESR